MRFSGRTFSETDFEDIQGLVRFGHGHLKEARFVLLNIADPAAARAWLAQAQVTDAATRHPPRAALHVAFTHDGLRKLGLPDDMLRGFSDEFIVGMAGDESRSRRLGDVGCNDPARWRWGQPGKVPHMMVLLYAETGDLADWETKVKTAPWSAAFAELARLATETLTDTEPFGFKDGISQPVLDWERSKPQRLRDTLDYTNIAALGEFLLGYRNEYARYTDRPLIDDKDDPARILPLAEDRPGQRDFGRNGTYLVFRDLEQDVPAFWNYVDEAAQHDPDERRRLANAMVGRTMDGDPIVRLRPEPIEGVAAEPEAAWRNQFTFDNDPDGIACPFGAHIRRVNPRNADLPPDARKLVRRVMRVLGFGSTGPRDDLLSSTRFHRILRRGRKYKGGLYFIGLNANISRQFEFVQTAWIASPKFDGLDERDPLLGLGPPANHFTRPQDDGLNRRVTGIPQFVTVRGGAYFFMPGLAALRYLTRVR